MENVKLGDKVICSGFPGTVVDLCEWSDNGLAEVRLERGTVCVAVQYLEPEEK